MQSHQLKIASLPQKKPRILHHDEMKRGCPFLTDSLYVVMQSGNYFTRSPYERSVVFTRILSPILMKRGAMMIAPVSRVTSF